MGRWRRFSTTACTKSVVVQYPPRSRVRTWNLHKHTNVYTHKQMAMGYKEVEEIKADGRKWAFRQCNNKNNNTLMINYPASWCLLSSSRGQSLTTFMCMLVSVQSRCSFLVQNSLKRNLRHNFVNKPIQSWTCKRGTKLSKEGTEREELRVT